MERWDALFDCSHNPGPVGSVKIMAAQDAAIDQQRHPCFNVGLY
jgi:hypothetical protein